MPRCPARPTRVLLAALLLPVALCASGCAAPPAPTTARRPTPTATVSPLARTVISASVSTRLVALRASDGQERWHVGDWTWPLPGGGGELIFGPVAPVADGGLLLATANSDHTGIPTAYAFTPADGSIRWHTPLAGCIAGGSPLVAGGVLYVALTGHASSNLDCGPSGWVYALREADGAVLWRRPFARVVFPSLELSGGVLVVLNDDYPADPETAYLTGLRPGDGAVLWQMQRPAGLSETFAAANGVVVLSRALRVGDTDRWTAHLEAFRAADGASVWQGELAIHFGATIEASAHGLVYVYSDLGELDALRVADGSTAWHFEIGVQSIGLPALVGGALYFGAGPSLVVLDAASGTLVREYTLTVPGSPTSTADDAPSVWTRPLLTGGAIVVAGAIVTSGGFRGYAAWALYAFDQASGRVLWQRPAEAEARYSAPVAVELPVGG
jgi:outer membrane protein assembly factor BamB